MASAIDDCEVEVIAESPQVTFDGRECLLDGIEIGGVRREEDEFAVWKTLVPNRRNFDLYIRASSSTSARTSSE